MPNITSNPVGCHPLWRPLQPRSPTQRRRSQRKHKLQCRLASAPLIAAPLVKARPHNSMALPITKTQHRRQQRRHKLQLLLPPLRAPQQLHCVRPPPGLTKRARIKSSFTCIEFWLYAWQIHQQQQKQHAAWKGCPLRKMITHEEPQLYMSWVALQIPRTWQNWQSIKSTIELKHGRKLKQHCFQDVMKNLRSKKIVEVQGEMLRCIIDQQTIQEQKPCQLPL